MEATVQDFPDFLEGVTSAEAQDLLPEIAEMKSAWEEEDGLVPRAALGELFGISKQAASNLKKQVNSLLIYEPTDHTK